MSFSEDPTQGRRVGERPGEDPTAPSREGPSYDPTQGREVGEEDPHEDPTEGREVGERPGEDPTDRSAG